MAHSIKHATKMQTFNQLLLKTATALDDVDNYNLLDNKVSEATFVDLQEMQALRAIALINYITNNAETLVEELVSEISE
jgi:hypothetical protein